LGNVPELLLTVSLEGCWQFNVTYCNQRVNYPFAAINWQLRWLTSNRCPSGPMPILRWITLFTAAKTLLLILCDKCIKLTKAEDTKL